MSRLKQCPGVHCRNSSYSLGSRERSQESLLTAAGLNTWTGEGAIRRGATVAFTLLWCCNTGTKYKRTLWKEVLACPIVHCPIVSAGASCSASLSSIAWAYATPIPLLCQLQVNVVPAICCLPCTTRVPAGSRPEGQNRDYLGWSKARDIPAWVDAALVAGPWAGPAACAEVCTTYSSGICRGCFLGARGYKQLPLPSCSGHSAQTEERT